MASATQSIQALLGADARAIRRDSLQRMFLAYPFIVGIVLRFLTPWVQERMADRYDIAPLYPLLTSFFGLTVVAALGGIMVGFLLLDERDAGTLTALLVQPLPMRRYVAYKMAVPVLVTFFGAYIIIALMGLMRVDPLALLPMALLAALASPIIVLIFISVAANKVQGLALMKGISLFMSGPFIAWFVPEPWQWLFGVFPTYWPLKAFWQWSAGESMWPWLAIGLVVNLLYLVPLLMTFTRRLYRGR